MKKLFTLLTGTFLTASSFAQLIYKDDFAGQTSGALPNPPFTVINNDANTIDPFYTGQSLFADAWELRNFGNGIAAYSCAYFTATGTASDWMILGPLSLPTGSSPTLSFETYCDVSGTTYRVYATSSIAGSTPAVSDFPGATQKATGTASNGSFQPAATVNLASLAGSNTVYIAFVNTSSSPAANPKDILGIRNIRLVAPIAQDVANGRENYGGTNQPNDIFAADYDSYCVINCNTNSFAPTFQIKNVGTAAITDYTAYLEIDDTIRITQPVTLSSPLAAGDSLTHTFSTAYNYTDPLYVARMWAAVAGDSIGDNDTIFNLLIVADSVYNPATAKVVQSFEVADANDQIDFDALTWVKIDANKDGKTFGIGTSNDAITPSDGDFSLFFDPKGALSTLSEWVISPCFQLNAGTVYNLKVDAALYFGNTSTKTVKLFVGNDNKVAALTTQVGTFTITGADSLLTPKSVVFTVATSGIYNLGLNLASTQGAYFAFDNLSVDVLAKPTSAFTLITDNSGNNDCDKSVGVKVTAANEPANTYSWNFGDGGTATGYSPAAHVYGAYGTYTVKLVVSNLAGSDSSTQTVTVAAPATPVANFTSQNTVGKTFKFTNASTPTACVTYFWDFGVTSTAADTSILASPTYVYPTGGSYNVCLTVTNLDGAVNQKCASVNVATGIDDVLFNQNIAIYPNPSTGNVTFEVPTFEKNLSINVYNILGAEVRSIKEEANGMFSKNYNFSDLSNGTYIVKITNGNKTATKRLTINK